MNQGDFFAAKAARDKALDKVAGNAGPWMDQCLAMVRKLPPGSLWTTEQMRLHFVNRCGLPIPHHHNAWGAMTRQARRQGWLAETGTWAHMTTKKSHARRTMVYRRTSQP